MNRRITPKPFAAAIAKAATVLDIGATSVSRAPTRHRVIDPRVSAQESVAKDWAIVGREMHRISKGKSVA